MSHDVKYIGMDVHKEAIVIAVLNEGVTKNDNNLRCPWKWHSRPPSVGRRYRWLKQFEGQNYLRLRRDRCDRNYWNS